MFQTSRALWQPICKLRVYIFLNHYVLANVLARTHQPPSIYQIWLKSEKLVVDRRTDTEIS